MLFTVPNVINFCNYVNHIQSNHFGTLSNNSQKHIIYFTNQQFQSENPGKEKHKMVELYKPEGTYLDSEENRELCESLQGLEYAKNSGTVLEGVVTKCDNDKNLTVELGSFTGIIPKSEAVLQTGSEPVREIAIITRVGKAVCVKVTAIDLSGNEPVIMLSRKKAQEECYRNYITKLEPGEIIDARVTHTEPFGAFCDIGYGIISLLSVDCISVSRINTPSDRFFVGQYIKCAVKSGTDESGRISLTHKELLGTWEENSKNYRPGETATGIVRSIEPYGIFIELAPNLAGLAEWREDVRVGQRAAVYIKSIIPEKMKIKLVIVDTQNVETAPKLPEYFISEGKIGYWRYSPENSLKTVETYFGTNEE